MGDEERLIIMQTEDGITRLEREDLSVITYAGNIPDIFKEGDIVRAIVHSDENIEFISLDEVAMEARRIRRERRRRRCDSTTSTVTEEQ